MYQSHRLGILNLHNILCQIYSIKKNKQKKNYTCSKFSEDLAGSVSGAYDSWFPSCEFEFHAGRRNDLKSLKHF